MNMSYFQRMVPATRIASQLYTSFKSLLPEGTGDSGISHLPVDMNGRAEQIGKKLAETVPANQREVFKQFAGKVVKHFSANDEAVTLIDRLPERIPELTFVEGKPEGGIRTFTTTAPLHIDGIPESATYHLIAECVQGADPSLTFIVRDCNQRVVLNSRTHSDYPSLRKVEETLRHKLAI